jgi:FRG domain
MAGNPYIRAACASTLGSEIANRYLGCMSLTQALAICQHYDQATPLLDVTTNPAVALYFATQHHDSEVGVVGYWQCSGRGDECESLALIMAPPGFERLHRQSGYFICAAPATSAACPLVTIRFHHCPELEPVRPKCLASIGKCEGTDDEILGDPGNLREVLRSGIARSSEDTQEKTSQARSSTVEDTEKLLQIAVSTIGAAAGRLGIGERGRFLEIKPTLAMALFRYAPEHFLALTKLIKLKSKGLSLLRPLSATLVEILRAGSAESRGRLGLRDITDDELLDYFVMERRLSREELPWPINAWYE